MCIFCDRLKEEQIIHETEHFKIVFDIDPIQQGHLLVISKKHYMNFVELPDEALLELIQLERRIITILEGDMNIHAVSLFRNNGKAMDQSTHFHEHIVPRYNCDGFWNDINVEKRKFDFEQFNTLINQ